MSKIENIVQTIEKKIDKVIVQFGLIKEQNDALKIEIKTLKAQNKVQLQKLEENQAEFDSLKIASSMLGSNEDKRASKLKINALIKEINDCIASLSD
jgi:CRISPR/Cas system CMR-associated protein Cmr1 (group 7 of RAMP superfamily)